MTGLTITPALGVSGAVSYSSPNSAAVPGVTITLSDISTAQSKPTATGAVARAFSAQRGDVFNVKDFGATGNSSGTGDQAAVVAAAAVLLVSAVMILTGGRTRRVGEVAAVTGQPVAQQRGARFASVLGVGAGVYEDCRLLTGQAEGAESAEPAGPQRAAGASAISPRLRPANSRQSPRPCPAGKG